MSNNKGRTGRRLTDIFLIGAGVVTVAAALGVIAFSAGDSAATWIPTVLSPLVALVASLGLGATSLRANKVARSAYAQDQMIRALGALALDIAEIAHARPGDVSVDVHVLEGHGSRRRFVRRAHFGIASNVSPPPPTSILASWERSTATHFTSTVGDREIDVFSMPIVADDGSPSGVLTVRLTQNAEVDGSTFDRARTYDAWKRTAMSAARLVNDALKQ